MTLKEYLSGGGVFSLMSDSHIVPIASELDLLLDTLHGSRDVSSMISQYIETDGTVTSANRQTIADLIWLLYREKWSKYFDFLDADLTPWTTGGTTTEVTYGKVVADVDDGEDTVTRNDTIAGFDSTSLVDDNARTTTTEYGRETTSTQSGTDTIEVETRNVQAESLVDYMLDFWSKHGLAKQVTKDAAHELCVRVYD